MSRSAAEGPAARVVLVNDDPTQLRVLAGLLGREGLEVQTFAGAAAALAALDPRRPPGLIVTDLYMPGIDGWRFCRLLRSPEYQFCNHIPILVISATFAGEEATRITEELGANSFLPSPVDGGRFLEQVRALLAGGSARSVRRVLIVEDSMALATVLQKVFASHGYRADTACTVRAAAEAFGRDAYDIALLDYHLPDARGDSLLADFCLSRPDCVCIMMTTDPSPELALAWMRQGAAAYLRKPFAPEYLIEVCARVCRGRSLLRVEDLLEKRSRELRETEIRYRTLFEQSPDGVVILNPETAQPLEFNEQACRQLGYSRQEFANLTLADIEAGESAEESRAHIRQVMREGYDSFDTLQRTKQGEIRHVHVTAQLLEAGGRSVYHCIWRDITDRKLAAERLRQSEARVRAKLDAILLPEGDTGLLDLHDILDVGAIQELMNDFHKLTNIGVGIIDLHGRVLVATGWQDICSKFHRAHPEACRNCLESDIELSSGVPAGNFRIYKCKNHMWDIATPVMVGDRHLGNLFLGQFFFAEESPDPHIFAAQARQYGFNEAEYLAALQQVPRWSRETVNTIMNFYARFTTLISSLSYGNIKLARVVEERGRVEEALRESEIRLAQSNQLMAGVLEHTHMMAAYLDVHFNFIWVNRAYAQTCRQDPDFFPGKNHFALYPHEENQAIFQRVADTGEPFFVAAKPFEFPDQPERGVTYWDWSLVPTRDAAGSIAGLVFTLAEVTSRVRAEMALRQSEALLNATQRLTRMGGWEWDVERQAMFWTEEVYRIHDLPPGKVASGSAELVARSLECYDPEDRPVIVAAFQRCASEGQPYDLEFPFTPCSGGRIWVRTVAEAVMKAGKVVRVIGNIMDITERRNAEMALRDSEERYRLLFESMDSAFALHEIIRDDTGSPCNYRFLEVNPAFERMTGLAVRELIGRTVLDVLPGIESFWIERYGQVVDSGQTMHFESYSRELDKYYAVTAYCPRPEQFAVFCMDISDRKRAEADRERLLSAIEQSGEIIVITDAAGAIQYVNPAFERATGYSREEAVGRNPRILKSGRQDAAFYADMWRVISGGGNWQGRLINKRKDGTLFIEEATISPVRDAEGRIINYVAVKRDITEHLRIHEEKARLEAQFQQSQKLESVGRLAGGVAHDLNNLLSPILGYGEMLLEEFSEGDLRKTDMEEIVKAGKRARDLVRQLLALSRKQVMEFKDIDLNSVLAQFEKLLRRTIREDIAINIRSAPSLPLIRGDIGQLEQVIMNLAVNAQDAMPRGGRLTIETERVEVDEAYAGEKPGMTAGVYVRLMISDSGCGMDSETLAHMFEPFFTTKAKEEGTGLGLATVYGIVKQHGGSIWVYSEAGKGSTFKLYFPVAGEPGMAQRAGAADAAAMDMRGSETILLVEDNEQVRNLARTILSRRGYALLIARDGSDALDILDRHEGQLHLLLTDVIMPGMSGRELFDRLAGRYPEMKVLYMSGYTDNVIAHRGVLEAGVNFIQKPFTVNGLLAKVRKVLGQPAAAGI
ncbi:MAG: PAS domain S-box protein [Thermodesulfobacteriota bacterium]